MIEIQENKNLNETQIIENDKNTTLNINNTDFHKILSHNCTGFNKNHHSFFENDVSFILLQETWHLPSSKPVK